MSDEKSKVHRHSLTEDEPLVETVKAPEAHGEEETRSAPELATHSGLVLRTRSRRLKIAGIGVLVLLIAGGVSVPVYNHLHRDKEVTDVTYNGVVLRTNLSAIERAKAPYLEHVSNAQKKAQELCALPDMADARAQALRKEMFDNLVKATESDRTISEHVVVQQEDGKVKLDPSKMEQKDVERVSITQGLNDKLVDLPASSKGACDAAAALKEEASTGKLYEDAVTSFRYYGQ